MGIRNDRICQIEVRALALTHCWRGYGGVVLNALTGKGRLLGVMSRGVGIRIRWRASRSRSRLTAIGHMGCSPYDDDEEDALK